MTAFSVGGRGVHHVGRDRQLPLSVKGTTLQPDHAGGVHSQGQWRRRDLEQPQWHARPTDNEFQHYIIFIQVRSFDRQFAPGFVHDLSHGFSRLRIRGGARGSRDQEISGELTSDRRTMRVCLNI